MRDKTTTAMAAPRTNVMVGMLRSLSGGGDGIDMRHSPQIVSPHQDMFQPNGRQSLARRSAGMTMDL